jgi:arabinoxylan arabinofuranohydrolase
MNRLVFLLIFTSINYSVFSKNPIIPNKGANDPHIRIIDGKAYLSASHDKSAGNTKFIMEDWWLWSSDDLVNWKLEYTLKPEETYIGEPFEGCWATDFVKRNGKYYWYFSERNEQAGVMVANSPSGPWKDPLGKPLLSSEMTPTHEYDMGIFEDEKGDFYIVFGVWDYYIAKLNEDMISLAENPRKIEITNPHGPYNPDGKNTEKPTDDKPFLHFYNGKYYLSWGCFYAMADNVYGPYDYKGSIIEQESFAPGYDAPTWPNGFKQGRHGSFFEWHNQWYFAYCDISQTGNRYFRDTFISYVHYKENGEIALIRVDGIGVGEYDANQTIQAEDYFKAAGITKTENGKTGFEVADIDDNDFLIFNNIKGLKGKSKIEINATLQKNAQIEIHENTPDGKILATFNLGKKNMEQKSISFDFPGVQEKLNLCFVFKGKGNELLRFDSFSFY